MMARGAAGVVTIVLAAGQGKRMRSKRPKVLHPLAGRPMLAYVLDRAVAVGAERILVVIGSGGDRIREAMEKYLNGIKQRVEWIVQDPPAGTGHAVLQTEPLLAGYEGSVMILNGDHPLFREETLAGLLARHRQESQDLSLLSVRLPDPTGYGRVIRGADGRVLGVMEERDATEEQRWITEVNTGVYVVRAGLLFDLLRDVRADNAQGEYYLTDIVGLSARRGLRLSAWPVADPLEALGINTRLDLARAERIARDRVLERLMREGVSVMDPQTTWIDDTVRIGGDTVIYPGCWIEGETEIGEECQIGPYAHVRSSHLGHQVRLLDHCVVADSVLEDGALVGPFAHIRPGTRIRRSAKIGNFVEVKQSDLGEGSKANHLAYLGDAVIGREVNIGAGTITCNYDGVQKWQTVIEDHVFVGSDTQLVAPVRVGPGATIAAGSTITRDVPANALAIGRARQVNKRGWKRRQRQGPKTRTS